MNQRTHDRDVPEAWIIEGGRSNRMALFSFKDIGGRFTFPAEQGILLRSRSYHMEANDIVEAIIEWVDPHAYLYGVES